MSNKETVKVISEFSQLPDTEEKLKISNAYLNDEIGCFDFYSRAKAYLEATKQK